MTLRGNSSTLHVSDAVVYNFLSSNSLHPLSADFTLTVFFNNLIIYSIMNELCDCKRWV